jgi:hypothetical protein
MTATRINAPYVVLYDDDTYTNGPITLSESAANFSRLVICARSNDGFYSSAEVWHPDGKTVSLFSATPAGSAMYVKSRCVTISGTTISTSVVSGSTYAGQGIVKSSPSYANSNYLGITQVIGYR